MPRGNDGEAARQELEARVGIELNAEDLIRANAQRWPAELKAANSKRVDPDATAELDASALDRKVGKDQEVLSYAVRGKHVVVVCEDERGQVHKQAIELDDLGRAGSKAEKAGADERDEAHLAAAGRVAPEEPQSTPRKS